MHSFIINFTLITTLLSSIHSIASFNHIQPPSYIDSYEISSGILSDSTEIDFSKEINAILLNTEYLSDDDQKLIQDISYRYNQNHTLSEDDKKELIRLKTIIIKEKLGDDYEEFISILKKDKESITQTDKEKLRIFIQKLQE